MSYLMQSGDKFFPAASKEALLEGLPLGNYTIEQSMSGLYFKRVENFQPLNKVYGSLNGWADRTLQTFEDREVSTGILLSGEKGSGKSLLGRLISLKGREKQLPTVIINFPFEGVLLLSLLGELTQPVVVFFDEFEKVYNTTELQESVLSLLDGTSGTKHLFVITCNDMYRISNFLINRPGRIFYSIEFNGLEESFIREYCEDSLNNKSEIDNIIKLSKIFEKFNFDMLKSLVEEMNRYNETAMKAIELLNIVPNKQNTTYKLAGKDSAGKECKVFPHEWRGFPLENERFDFNFIVPKTGNSKDDDDDDDDDNWIPVAFLDSDLKNFDPSTKMFTYINSKGFVLTFQTPEKREFTWLDAM